jgi:hypothetical protein
MYTMVPRYSRRSNAQPSRARAHTHIQINTANRGSAVVAGLANGAQKRWNRRFPRLSFCQVSSRCCHHSNVDLSSPAKTGGWRKDFGHVISKQVGRAMVKAASTSAHQNTRSRSRVLNLPKRQEGRGDGRGHSNVSVADLMRVCTCAE